MKLAQMLRFLFFLVLVLVSGLRLVACPIPVYQYALEHWRPDAYRVVVRSGGDYTEAEQRGLELLRAVNGPAGTVANISLLEENLENPAGVGAIMELYYPEPSRIRRMVWSGALSEENARGILSSPARAELGKMLASRVSGVWILLESGDRRQDDMLEKTLKDCLARLEKAIVVPSSADWGGTTVQIDNKVNFKVIRVSRNEVSEQIFIRMLLASEADLEIEFSGQPMVFPVYGRGILLYALVGKGINKWTIVEAAEFLAGPCSCQIKSANPGTDLLIEMNWDSMIKTTTPAAVGGTVGTGSFMRQLEKAEAEEEGK